MGVVEREAPKREMGEKGRRRSRHASKSRKKHGCHQSKNAGPERSALSIKVQNLKFRKKHGCHSMKKSRGQRSLLHKIKDKIMDSQRSRSTKSKKECGHISRERKENP